MELSGSFRSEIALYLSALEAQLAAVLVKLISHEYPEKVFALSFEVFPDRFPQGFPARAFFMDRDNNEYFEYRNGKALYPSPVDPAMIKVDHVYPGEIEDRYADLDENFDAWTEAFEEFVVTFSKCWDLAGGQTFARRATIAAHDDIREFNLLTKQWQPAYSEFDS